MAKFDTLTDDFSSGSFSSTKWRLVSGCTVVSQQAKIPIAAGGVSSLILTWTSAGQTTYDLVDSSIFARIFPPVAASERQFIMEIRPTSGTSYIRMRYEAAGSSAQLYMDYSRNGTSVFSNVAVTWDATNMAWWRIRHDTAASDTLYLETAPDASGSPGTWTVRQSATSSAVSSWFTASKFQLWAYDALAGSAADSFADNVNVADMVVSSADTGTGTEDASTDWDVTSTDTGVFADSTVTVEHAQDSADTGSFVDAADPFEAGLDVDSADTGTFIDDGFIDETEADTPETATFAEDASVETEQDSADTGSSAEDATAEFEQDTEDVGEFVDQAVAEFVRRPTASSPLTAPVSTPPVVQFATGAWSSQGPDTELRTLTARRLRVSLLDFNQISFSHLCVPSEAVDFREGINDVWVRRNGVLLARCRIVSAPQEFGDVVSSSISAQDYRYVLDRRPIGVDSTWTTPGVEQADIIWALVQRGLDWGDGAPVSQGSDWTATGVTRTNVEIGAEATVWQAVRTVADMPGGCEPYIEPDLTVSLNYPEAGASNGVVLDYVDGVSGAVRSISRRADIDSYANVVRQSGATETTPVTTGLPGYATRPEGVWPKIVGDTSLNTNDMVTAAASANLTAANEVYPEYSMQLRQGFWEGPGHIWLGDTVQYVIRAGAFAIERQARVMEINISWDSSNVESVTLALSKNSLDGARRLRQTLKGLEYLSRR